jgi:transposase-like protein
MGAKVMKKQFKSLFDLGEAIPTEQAAIDYFTAIRWKNGSFCPHCEGKKIYTFSDKRTHKCADCRKRFSIKVGTIFEDTKIPLRKWFMAIWFMTSHTKGIASTQLAKDIDVTQKTAWFMMHRLRHAASTKSFNAPLKGIVEVDETWIGGKDANRHWDKKHHGQTGGAASGKTPVIGAVSRKGKVIARALSRVTHDAAQGFVREMVSDEVSLLATDENRVYDGLTEYPRQSVKHSAKQYVVGAVHTNTIEGVWALLKRQIIGIHHWVSPKHLDRYVQEMSWRYNRREATGHARIDALIACSTGRLTYRGLIA